MVRLVTQDDIKNNPDFEKRGISVNQYYDFPSESPTVTQSKTTTTPHYDITENTSVDYGVKPEEKKVAAKPKTEVAKPKAKEATKKK